MGGSTMMAHVVPESSRSSRRSRPSLIALAVQAGSSKRGAFDPKISGATVQDVRMELDLLDQVQQRWSLRFSNPIMEQRFQLYHEDMSFASGRLACVWTLLGLGIMQAGSLYDYFTVAEAHAVEVASMLQTVIVYVSVALTPFLWGAWAVICWKTRRINGTPRPHLVHAHVQVVLFVFALVSVIIVLALPAFNNHIHLDNGSESGGMHEVEMLWDSQRQMHQLTKMMLFLHMTLSSISTFWNVQFLGYVAVAGISLLATCGWLIATPSFIHEQWHVVAILPCAIMLLGAALYRHEQHLRLKFLRFRHLMLENIKLTQQNTFMQRQLSSHVDAIGISDEIGMDQHVHATEPHGAAVFGESWMENVLKILYKVKSHVHDQNDLARDMDFVIQALLSEQDLFMENKFKQQRSPTRPNSPDGIGTSVSATSYEYSEWLALIDEQKVRRRKSCDVLVDVPVVRTIRRTESGYRQTVLKQVENYLSASRRHLKPTNSQQHIQVDSPAAYLPPPSRPSSGLFTNEKWSSSTLLMLAMQSEELDMLEFASVCMFPLTSIFLTTIESHNLFGELPLRVESTAEYGLEIESRYQAKNPYHNATHSAAVVWDVNFFLRRLQQPVTPLHVLSAIIAATIHDVNHPGISNTYLVNTNSPLAIKYSDDSVLERMHLAEGFQACTKQGCDLFEDFTRDMRRQSRQLIISMVLATDLSRHIKHVNRLKSKRYAVIAAENATAGGSSTAPAANASGQTVPSVVPVDLLLQSILMMADLGHAAKTFEYHYEWSKLVTEEFFRQGDTEKQFGMPISPLCDRQTMNKFDKNQVGFLEFVVLPLYSAVHEVIPITGLEDVIDQVRKNMLTWKQRAECAEQASGDTTAVPASVSPSIPTATAGQASPRRPRLDSVGSVGSVHPFDSTASITVDVPDTMTSGPDR